MTLIPWHPQGYRYTLGRKPLPFVCVRPHSQTNSIILFFNRSAADYLNLRVGDHLDIALDANLQLAQLTKGRSVLVVGNDAQPRITITEFVLQHPSLTEGRHYCLATRVPNPQTPPITIPALRFHLHIPTAPLP